MYLPNMYSTRFFRFLESSLLLLLCRMEWLIVVMEILWEFSSPFEFKFFLRNLVSRHHLPSTSWIYSLLRSDLEWNY